MARRANAQPPRSPSARPEASTPHQASCGFV
jgi:hypothetical protein